MSERLMKILMEAQFSADSPEGFGRSTRQSCDWIGVTTVKSPVCLCQNLSTVGPGSGLIHEVVGPMITNLTIGKAWDHAEPFEWG